MKRAAAIQCCRRETLRHNAEKRPKARGNTFSPLAIRQDVGALWENYIIGKRRKANFNEGLHKEFYSWRTYDKQEIDLIEESPDNLTALEFKWGNKTPKAPKAFQDAYPQAEFHVVNQENYLEFI